MEAVAENLVDQLPKMNKSALLDLVNLLKGTEQVSSNKDVKAVIVAEIVDKLVKAELLKAELVKDKCSAASGEKADGGEPSVAAASAAAVSE